MLLLRFSRFDVRIFDIKLTYNFHSSKTFGKKVCFKARARKILLKIEIKKKKIRQYRDFNLKKKRNLQKSAVRNIFITKNFICTYRFIYVQLNVIFFFNFFL